MTGEAMNAPINGSAMLASSDESTAPRRFQFRLRTLFCLTAAAIVAGVVAIRREADPWHKVRWWEGRLAGQSRSAVVKKLGPPENECSGHYGLPGAHFVKLHPVAKTLIFPQPSGKLYASFEPQGSQWIVFGCSYLPDGAAF